MTRVDLPVFFLGRDTGLAASSKIRAAIAVREWLLAGRGPAIDPLYCPAIVRRPQKPNVPTSGRLVRNTILRPDRYDVGLGLPARNRRRPPRDPEPGKGRRPAPLAPQSS